MVAPNALFCRIRTECEQPVENNEYITITAHFGGVKVRGKMCVILNVKRYVNAFQRAKSVLRTMEFALN